MKERLDACEVVGVHYEHVTCGNRALSFSSSFDEFKTFFILVFTLFTSGT